MNATAPETRDAAMDETIAHDPCSPEIRPRGLGRYTFASGSRPLDGYTLKRAIGRGGFGEVYYATSDAGKEVAIKLITRNLEVERRGVVQCMNLKSPHLIGIHDLRTNDEGDTFVIMEYVAGLSLANILEKHPKGLPLDDVRHWLKGLVEGVSYLHDHGIVHRDLKPANLFLEEGVVKIGDYGLSKAITQSREPGHSESVGTCHYMAPEISTGKYHKPIDIYAMGIILYELITGRVPFDGESVGEILMKHLTSRPDLSPLPEPYRSIVG
ncbi:MAG TPA: serine/threonine-protein kinase, partial [Isosphaeraceae bacterium]|nr:serine/threonine-protein kinase [Isosphaeraceae bacterium]